MFIRVKTSSRYRYLRLAENHCEGRRTVQGAGQAGQLAASGAVDVLLRSLGRPAAQVRVIEAHRERQPEVGVVRKLCPDKVQLPKLSHRRQEKPMWWIPAAVFLLSLLRTPFAAAQPALLPHGEEQGYILYVPLSPDMSKEALLLGGESLKDRLHSLVRERLTLQKRLPEDVEAIDRIVVFTDHDKRPILPDLDAAKSRRSNAGGVSAPLAATANELTFTFDSPTFPWSVEELTTLTTTLKDCYPAAKKVYGDPAFNITVNVRKDPTISFAGLYYVSLNEIVVRNASQPDPICHEMIHAFRDDNIIGLSSYEEGMTRAAEVEVFNLLPTYTYWDAHHSYTYDVYYEGLNRQKIAAQNGNFFLGYVSVLLRYQLAGYAWGKVLLENSNFLVDFNRELYARTLSDSTTPTTESKLLDIAATLQSTVEGKPFPTWYGQQGVLNTNPPKGYLLYQRINQFTVDFFYRDPFGWETMQPEATIEWAVYDYQDTLLDSGSDLTSPLGWTSFVPTLPTDYNGRIKVVVTVASPDGIITDTSLRYAGSEAGVFGIVPDANFGTITLTPLDHPTPPVHLNVVNGAFSASALAGVKGRVRAIFTSENGMSFQKQFTKDASNYFLSISDTAPSVKTAAIDIKPGEDPNPINLRSKGKIPVAILTADIFDATTVDPLSVKLGPHGATEAHRRGHIKDVDGDGDLDLLLHFNTQDTGIKCRDTSASLTGETFDGQAIQGSDSIKTVGCK